MTQQRIRSVAQAIVPRFHILEFGLFVVMIGAMWIAA